MGCISSKVTRSTSTRDRRNHGGASVTTWEELFTSHSGKDKLFSFVATKLTNSNNFTVPSGDHGPHQHTKDDDDRTLIPELRTKTEVLLVESASGAPESASVKFTRSRSCQEPRKNEDNGNDGGVSENKIDWRDKNTAGSISFHTVEEYDALLERIRRFGTRKIDYENQDDTLLHDRSNRIAKENYIQVQSGTTEDQKGTGSLTYYNDFEEVVRASGRRETGWKRRSMAKGLKSLDVSTTEFSGGIARFKQRHNLEGHIYSPGTYVTPKFGSYNAKVTAPAEKEKRGGEDSVFSPELVAAFEDCMQQLQEEEDSILNHMDGEYSESPVDDVLENRGNKVSIKDVLSGHYEN